MKRIQEELTMVVFGWGVQGMGDLFLLFQLFHISVFTFLMLNCKGHQCKREPTDTEKNTTNPDLLQDAWAPFHA